MRIYADLHIHSRFARACSKEINIKNLEKWAKIKGVALLGTGDFSHPLWLKELKSELREDKSGVFKTRSGFNFLLQNEISLMYSQGGRGRRVHLLLFAPDFKTVDQINTYLSSKGRLDYDGRPIFNISCMQLAEKMMSINERIEIIPAHVWTPWFGLFGSKSGFNSVDEAFGPMTKYIHCLETGLSSDPEMNRMLSSLDRFNLVSFSDAHSYWPWRIGRELTIFELERLSYDDVLGALRTKRGLAGTLEVDPAYGMYHFDGHRDCNVSLDPLESNKLNKICPVCKKGLTIGVLNRVGELADRQEASSIPFHLKILPLHDLISALRKTTNNSKKVWSEYNKLLQLGSELDILLKLSSKELDCVASSDIIELIMKNREGQIRVRPGYDGVYGALELGEQLQSSQLFRDTSEHAAGKEQNARNSPQSELKKFL